MTNYTPILGIKVNPLTYASTLEKIINWIEKDEASYICPTNVYTIMEAQKDTKLFEGVNNANLVTPDGMPLVWISNLYGNDTERVYGPTLMLKVCKIAEKNGYKVFLLGGKKGVSGRLADRLVERFPKLKIVGNIDTPKRPIPKK